MQVLINENYVMRLLLLTTQLSGRSFRSHLSMVPYLQSAGKDLILAGAGIHLFLEAPGDLLIILRPRILPHGEVVVRRAAAGVLGGHGRVALLGKARQGLLLLPQSCIVRRGAGCGGAATVPWLCTKHPQFSMTHPPGSC